MYSRGTFFLQTIFFFNMGHHRRFLCLFSTTNIHKLSGYIKLAPWLSRTRGSRSPFHVSLSHRLFMLTLPWLGQLSSPVDHSIIPSQARLNIPFFVWLFYSGYITGKFRASLYLSMRRWQLKGKVSAKALDIESYLGSFSFPVVQIFTISMQSKNFSRKTENSKNLTELDPVLARLFGLRADGESDADADESETYDEVCS